MAENSKIEWTTHTFNPWRGCTKVSAGCANCYADQLSGRNPKTLGVWGPRGTRVVAAESAWKEPLKWDRLAAAAGERHRVFCASLADVFEGPDTMPAESWGAINNARDRLFGLIASTPNLDWLLLTKRPENAQRFLNNRATKFVAHFGAREFSDKLSTPWPLPNLWIGTSVEDQASAEKRIPQLLKCPAAVRFLSMEPLIGPVNLDLGRCETHNRESVIQDAGRGEFCNDCAADGFSGELTYGMWLDACASVRQPGINWVIVGGESGPGARPFNVQWARDIVGQCKEAGVPVFVKQFGAVPVEPNSGDDTEYCDTGGTIPLRLKDRKGGDWSEWDDDLRVREFPQLQTV